MSKTITLEIEGMTCNGCSNGIKARTSKFDFVEKADVEWEAAKGDFTLTDASKGNVEKLKEAISQLGYKVLN